MIAVHAGAGYHSESKCDIYKQLVTTACKKAIDELKRGGNALDCVTIAVKSLEDSPHTNAGTGSNLTIDGAVECDAMVMDGLSLQFGAVGATSGMKNPVEVAKLLIDKQKEGNLSLGRIPPSILVGNGVQKWLKENDYNLETSHNLLTDDSVKTYEKYKRKLENHREKMKNKRQKIHRTNTETCKEENLDRIEPEDKVLLQDTVGAIAMDTAGNLASAVSSGGIHLKQSGRLGPAACYGSGCWAYNWSSEASPGVAVATSGSGEHLMKTLFSKECASCIQKCDNASLGLSQAFKDHFLESEYLRHIDDKYGGAIALRQEIWDTKKSVELVWGHTTESMCIGFSSIDYKKPKVFLSRLPPHGIPGKSFTMEGTHFTL